MKFTDISTDQKDAEELANAFSAKSGLRGAEYVVKQRSDGPYLFLYLANPTERYYQALNEACDAVADDNLFVTRATIVRRPGAPSARLTFPESRYLRTILSESLTVSRHSFEKDFSSRYIRSVFGAEDQVIAEGNHIVYGRRGAGKSSLLAYLLHQLHADNRPFAWVAMQTYEGRSGHAAIPQVFVEILNELKAYSSEPAEIEQMIKQLDNLASQNDGILERVEREIPRIRRMISTITQERGVVTLFLDDIHVVSRELQPLLLAKLYAVSRGNRTFLKLSGIEQFTRLWDAGARQGLQATHDIQIIPLDYNLTMPKKSLDHIESILNAHARFCGLPDIRYLCGDRVIERLVLAAAGVPRDALNIFAQAMSRATVRDNKRVSITSINGAVSEMAEGKLRDIQLDAAEDFDEVNRTLEAIRYYCISKERTNAFLVEIENNSASYKSIEKLIALRLLHLLSEGITPNRASRRYKALMLDFGFYVGIRAAKSVHLFQSEPKELQAKELRNLPTIKSEDLARYKFAHVA